jgi:AcrR family transcriptional regulator
MREHRKTDSPPRPYRLGKREASMAATRLRIVESTLELHSTVGPARTSIAAIAARAGVQRHTVYHHFPDLESLFEACTRHGIESTGMPDGAAWSTIDDPAGRARVGLTELTAWYRANRDMLDRVLADSDPGATDLDDPYGERLRGMFDRLREPWRVASRRAQVFDAVLAHAMAYETWRSLATGGLDDEGIVDLLVSWIAAAGAAR